MNRDFVDRQVKGLAHACVFKRVAFHIRGTQFVDTLVHAKENRTYLCDCLNIEAFGALDALDVLQRRVEHKINFARQQGRHAGRSIGDGTIFDPVEVAGEEIAAPPIWVRGQHCQLIRRAAHHRKRASAVSIAHSECFFFSLKVLWAGHVVCLRPVLVHDIDGRQLVR